MTVQLATKVTRCQLDFRCIFITDRHLLSQYTYTEKQTLMQLDSKGAPKTTEVNVFEVFPGSPERVGYSTVNCEGRRAPCACRTQERGSAGGEARRGRRTQKQPDHSPRGRT